MAFYTFRQNNSGGFWSDDILSGITRYVIIEANSASEANDRAEDIGLYFDGCDDDRDCSCCGDRWDRTYERDATEQPELYRELVGEKEGNDVAVHYLNGTFKLFGQ
jgi:hypothetical protein